MGKDKKKILLTGGGTTGHVSVNLALIPMLKEEGWDIYYMGSKNGIERELVEEFDYVNYLAISTGKLRRYFDWENFKDFFRVIAGVFQASHKIRKVKPDIIFSKGGFVSVPPIIGGFFNRVPALSHESDLTPGLANKLSQPFVKKIFTTFEDTTDYIKDDKGYFLGPVIRESLKNGDRKKAKEFLGLKNDKENILVMGGSLGARQLNANVREVLDDLLEDYNVIHAVGKGGLDSDLEREGYYQMEYINEELKDILALADMVVSRAGSNAIFEFLYYKIPMLLIPLPLSQSRGDQLDNAKSFQDKGYAKVLDEDDMTREEFLKSIREMSENKAYYEDNMKDVDFDNTIGIIYDQLEKYRKK